MAFRVPRVCVPGTIYMAPNHKTCFEQSREQREVEREREREREMGVLCTKKIYMSVSDFKEEEETKSRESKDIKSKNKTIGCSFAYGKPTP